MAISSAGISRSSAVGSAAAARSAAAVGHSPKSTDGQPSARKPSGREWARYLARFLRLTDSLTVVLSVLLGYVLRFDGGHSFAESHDNAVGAVLAAGLVVLWLGALHFYRTRDPKVLGVGSSEYKRVAVATTRVFGLLAVFLVVFRLEPAWAFYVASFPLGLLALVGNRWLARRWYNRKQADGQFLVKAIVIGQPEDVRYVLGRIAKKTGAAYEILGVSLPGARRGMMLDVDGRRIPVLSSTDDVVRTVGKHGAEAVIVAGPVPGGNQYIRELGWRLEEHRAELVLASTLTNVAGPRIHWRPVEGLPLMHVDVPQYSGGKHVLKRLLDIAGASVALVLLSPLFLALAVVVKRNGPGPVFFKQERVGKAGRPFRMIKFRSMVTDAEASLGALMAGNQGAGALFKMRDDPRVTSCGRWMRRYSLDELPQFWNVLTGEMSLVGPRPPLQREVEAYERHTHRRLLIKPGITGLWQVNGRSDLPWDEAVRLDLYYVENWSIMGDVIIMWRTFKAMCMPSGAY
ncbi:sugar transferase [Arthrobacter sp. B10-11]|uniref:sugar transferase n=1 Tax=Arthrobacter sp. B10-11 TaxID=3081160 RepID=UPI0029559384|nr:sugar transferase [Arthrobacter sp. B10-11]MDV8149794.1 sugar transferase [Arthrobacter sp. B10-11]